MLYIQAFTFCAEEEGFEPPVPCGTTVFKTAAFDHSAIPPGAKLVKIWILKVKKGKIMAVLGIWKDGIVKNLN